MKKLLTISCGFYILLLASCGGAPDTYTKAEQLYMVQKYDSAMYYFDRLLPEEEAWYDSAKVMKKRCFSEIVNHHFWDMYVSESATFKNDTALISHANSALRKELRAIVDMDSMEMLYRIIDNNKEMPLEFFAEASQYYEDKLLPGYEWECFKGMAGQKIYFVREIVDNWKGENEGNKMQAKSNRSKSGWTKDNVIYRNICYDSAGIYVAQPRIFQNGRYRNKQYFGKGGSMRIVSKDTLTLIINYGGAVSSNNRIWFVRRDKLEEKPDA